MPSSSTSKTKRGGEKREGLDDIDSCLEYMTSDQWAAQYGVDTEAHPLFAAYYNLYSRFLLQAVSKHTAWEIPDLAELKSTDPYDSRSNKYYDGECVVYMLICKKECVKYGKAPVGHPERRPTYRLMQGEPMAFAVIQHLRPKPSCPALPPQDKKAGASSIQPPELVYLAHLGGRPADFKGVGDRLLRHVLNMYAHVHVLLEMDHENWQFLSAHYAKSGFVGTANVKATRGIGTLLRACQRDNSICAVAFKTGGKIEDKDKIKILDGDDLFSHLWMIRKPQQQQADYYNGASGLYIDQEPLVTARGSSRSVSGVLKRKAPLAGGGHDDGGGGGGGQAEVEPIISPRRTRSAAQTNNNAGPQGPQRSLRSRA